MEGIKIMQSVVLLLTSMLLCCPQMCLGIIQRLITNQVVDQKGARYITDTLWMLMEAGTEEVKILQSVTLLLTTNTVVHGDTLARVCTSISSSRGS